MTAENFWQDLPKPFFILAPMEDVTDVAFRHVVAKAGRPDVFFTEFTNSASYCHPDGIESVKGRLTYTHDEQPLVAHIWGDVPDNFAEMAKGMKEMGFAGVDINMGCPAPNVFKHGRGSGLILRPEVAAQLIHATKEGGLPVSVKTRLGHAKPEEYKVWLKHVLEQGIANLSIHLRTKTEMSKVDAHWEMIGEIKELRDRIAPDTLLTINGDIPNRQVGLELVEKYGIDGVMIGRGIFHNPYAFEKVQSAHSPKELIDLFRYHLDQFDKYQLRPFPSMKRSFKIYIRGFAGANELRIALMDAKNTDECRKLVDEFEAKQL
ncbi:tRNA dihydrouridine synthase [Streptococcus parauberis]|uniref:tRNA dihydrouridine synthase n=1 Tax=Streptococcus parauberis TaxID=1348 RepID=UPI000C1CB629|nr:tRNA-dihydrouridine synthase [Streptococcus parauberis]PIO78388.1 putative tRNA-dihydrouridine synthase [Streptococcus parauberis]POS67958.1 putative tRNA-dihydrouridine synthase [Streptococcus parauberis]